MLDARSRSVERVHVLRTYGSVGQSDDRKRDPIEALLRYTLDRAARIVTLPTTMTPQMPPSGTTPRRS